MLFKYDEILKKYKNDVAIAKAIEKNELYRLTRGIYSDKKNIDQWLYIQKGIQMP